MNQLRAFIRNALFGGFVVMLPLAIFLFFFKWIFNLITDAIQPITNMLVNKFGMPEMVADIAVIYLIILVCFVVGVVVSTSFGRWLHNRTDKYLVKAAPGYRLIKEIVQQFFGDKSQSPFANGQVARARIFGLQSPTEVSAIVTCKHSDGHYTIFVPTGPNPTSGNIYHVPAELLTFCPDVPVDSFMRTIIACGAGSQVLYPQPATLQDIASPVTVKEGSS